MRKVLIYVLTVAMLCSLAFTAVVFVGAEDTVGSQDVIDVMSGGKIESAAVIDNAAYGNIGLWYHNGGALDAEFTTDRLYNAAQTGSTGAMLHHGAKNVFYRFFQDYNKVIDTEYTLKGYVYTAAENVSLAVSLVNMMGMPPYSSVDYSNIKTVPLTKDGWTEISLTFRFDSQEQKLFVDGAEKQAATLDSQYDILNVSFAQEGGPADVVYDEWSCTYGAEAQDFSDRDYDGRFADVEDLTAIEGNLIPDADMTVAPSTAQASGKWFTYALGGIEKTEDQKLTGDTSIRATYSVAAQDMRIAMPLSVTGGKPTEYSVFAKKDAATTERFGLELMLAVSAWQGAAYESEFQFAFITFDSIELSADEWRELKGTVKCYVDEDAHEICYSINGGAETAVGGVASLISAELLVRSTTGAGIAYIDSATCFAEHESKVKYLDSEGKPVSGLTLGIKDAFGRSVEGTAAYDDATGYYTLPKSAVPLAVTATVNGKEITKTVFAGREDLTVVVPYAPKVTLKDGNGAPITGAQVKLVAGNGKEITLTDSQGTGVYTCTELLDEISYKVNLFHANYTFAASTITNVNYEIEVVGTSAAAATWKATVTLVDNSYNAISGAKVELLENGEVIYTLAEDEAGEYSLDGIDGFEFTVRVTLSGYTFEEDVVLNANNRSITVSGKKADKESGCGCDSAVGAANVFLALGTLATAVLLIKRKKAKGVL